MQRIHLTFLLIHRSQGRSVFTWCQDLLPKSNMFHLHNMCSAVALFGLTFSPESLTDLTWRKPTVSRKSCMKNYLITLIGAALLVSTIGCANGPIRNWFRGAPCNACNPQIQQPLNLAPPCDGCAENTVGSGLLGKMFKGNSSQPIVSLFKRNTNQQPIVSNCSSGTCNPISFPPASVPASSFVNVPPSFNAPPPSVPASEFVNDLPAFVNDLPAPSYLPTPTPSNSLPRVVDPVGTAPAAELYGNPNSVGKLELPPLGFQSKN